MEKPQPGELTCRTLTPYPFCSLDSWKKESPKEDWDIHHVDKSLFPISLIRGITHLFIHSTNIYWVLTMYHMEKAMATPLLPGKSQGGRRLVGCSPPGSPRVGHDWATSLSLFTFMHWRRKRQPTPVFLPGESQGQRSLVGCHLWGRTESDTTEVT